MNHAHLYWGMVEEDWAGFSAELEANIPPFVPENITIFLGAEYDEEGEEIEDTPSPNQLNVYQETYQNFLEQFPSILVEMQNQAFAFYQKYYAHFYEQDFEADNFNGKELAAGEKHPPLNIDNSSKHFVYMKEIKYIRILDGDAIQIVFNYELDTEHGLEIKLINNKITNIGGIAET